MAWPWEEMTSLHLVSISESHLRPAEKPASIHQLQSHEIRVMEGPAEALTCA